MYFKLNDLKLVNWKIHVKSSDHSRQVIRSYIDVFFIEYGTL